MWVLRTELCVNYTEEVWNWVRDPDDSKMLTQLTGLPSVCAGGLEERHVGVLMGGVCRGGTPHSVIAVPSGCSQVRGPDWGWEEGGGAVMVGRRDQGGMTIWWSSSMHTHTPLSKSLSHALRHTSTCPYLWLWYGLLLRWLIPSVLELQLWGSCTDMESRASGSL